MKTVEGKVVLVTGGAMGMGRLYAERAVAERAAALVLWDVDANALEATREALTAQSSTRVLSETVDVASLKAVQAAAARLEAEVGSPDIVINNAGVVRGRLFWEHAAEDSDWIVGVNVLGPMHVAHAFLPGMIASGRESRLLNVASASGFLAVPRMSVYTGSKWALIGWSDSLRLELEREGHRHVRVTTLIPSYIRTPMFAGARPPRLTSLLEPEYVVEKAWAAMKAGRPRLMLPWTVALARGLAGLLPQPLWDRLADRVFGVYSSMEAFTGRTRD